MVAQLAQVPIRVPERRNHAPVVMTNIDFDAEGRLYVAEGVNYRHAGGTRPEGDRVVILSDTDGNGQADTTEVFVQDKNLR